MQRPGMSLFQRRSEFSGRILDAAFALVAAILIWSGVGARLSARRTLDFELELGTATGVVADLEESALIRVTLEGPKAVLDALAEDPKVEGMTLRPRIPLTAAQLGDRILEGYILDLDPARDVELPRRLLARVRALSCEPGVIKLALSPVVRRQIPIKVELAGRLASKDLAVQRLELKPPRVTVIGSLRALLRFESGLGKSPLEIPTQPLRLDDQESSFSLISELALPPGLSSEPDRVEVSVTVAPRSQELSGLERRLIELPLVFGLPSEVASPLHFEARPARSSVSLTLEGKRAELDALEAALRGSDPSRRPFALLRIPPDIRPGPQSGELELSHIKPGTISIRGDRSLLYEVKGP